jgi:hypothetical protein
VYNLIDNDESLLLLLHVTPSFFVKYFLLKIFKKFLKTLPLDIWLLNKSRLNWDSLAGEITSSFVSFNFILFLEILKNLNYKKYLFELIDFLTFLAQENLIFKYDFDVFVKTSEFIFFKALRIESQSQRISAIISLFKLFHSYMEKGFPKSRIIVKKELQIFKSFCLKIFIYIFEELLVESFEDKENYVLHILKVIPLMIKHLSLIDPNEIIGQGKKKLNMTSKIFNFDFSKFIFLMKKFFDLKNNNVRI